MSCIAGIAQPHPPPHQLWLTRDIRAYSVQCRAVPGSTSCPSHSWWVPL